MNYCDRNIKKKFNQTISKQETYIFKYKDCKYMQQLYDTVINSWVSLHSWVCQSVGWQSTPLLQTPEDRGRVVFICHISQHRVRTFLFASSVRRSGGGKHYYNPEFFPWITWYFYSNSYGDWTLKYVIVFLPQNYIKDFYGSILCWNILFMQFLYLLTSFKVVTVILFTVVCYKVLLSST